MRKRILVIVLCMVLCTPVLSAMAGESLLSPGASSLAAGSDLGFKVNLGAIPEDYLTYSITIKVNPSPEKVTVSENVNMSGNPVNGTYTISSSDLSSITALNFKVTPASNITSDTTYTVTVSVDSEAGHKSDDFSFTAKAPEQTEPTQPDEPEQPDTPDDPSDFDEDDRPEMKGKPRGKFPSGGFSMGGGTSSSSLVYAGSADNYLKSLSVDDHEFTRSFNKTRNTYFVDANDGVTSLKVSAKACDSSAKVSITGADDVGGNMSKIQINVTADNGDVRIYRIYVRHDTEE